MVEVVGGSKIVFKCQLNLVICQLPRAITAFFLTYDGLGRRRDLVADILTKPFSRWAFLNKLDLARWANPYAS